MLVGERGGKKEGRTLEREERETRVEMGKRERDLRVTSYELVKQPSSSSLERLQCVT